MGLISPLIVGGGRAGEAIARSLYVVSRLEPRLQMETPVIHKRGAPLVEFAHSKSHPILIVANPHGLHAPTILEGAAAGFRLILAEKPSCVSPDQMKKLREVQTPVAIFHGYRQMWGPQTLKTMLTDGELGELIAIEGRYWQSSAAERALEDETEARLNEWKNDTELSGPYDALLDIGTHWMDMASYLVGKPPSNVEGWLNYANAPAPHRDCHVQVMLGYENGARAMGSISKTVHGATNHFEINVLGTKQSATWKFLTPDEIEIGHGRNRAILARKTSHLGSHQSPFHALGWLEGYTEICHQILNEVFLGLDGTYPSLQENLELMAAIFEGKYLRAGAVSIS